MGVGERKKKEGDAAHSKGKKKELMSFRNGQRARAPQILSGSRELSKLLPLNGFIG